MLNNPVSEKLEIISYYPTVKDTTDLEAGTNTITATSEASGIGNANYNAALTLAAPSDARLVIKRIATRLSFTIDSFDVATTLYCRVYVDAQDANHLLIDTSHTVAENKLDGQEVLVGTKEIIFDLLKDGASHTFYFFFWVNQANNAVISLVQLWEGVGTYGTASGECLRATHKGFIQTSLWTAKEGSGTHTITIFDIDTPISGEAVTLGKHHQLLTKSGLYWKSQGTVATDLNYLRDILLVLRSEQ